MSTFPLINAVTEQVFANSLSKEHSIFFKRDDLIHSIVSGNKWRKLEHHIEAAKSQNKTHLVTFGGAFSNHMVAVACAGAVLGFKTSCFIRGEELNRNSNFYLQIAVLYGMHLIPVDRIDYREKKDYLFRTHFENNADCYCIPEGGGGEFGMLGVADIISELTFEPDYIIHASATATTASGLLLGLNKNGFKNTTLLPVNVLKNESEQLEKLNNLRLNQAFKLITGFEFGGYAKTSPELMVFIQKFISETGILIDPVYTGKALYALKSLCESGEISSDKKVLFLHTGGMLGLFSEKMMARLFE